MGRGARGERLLGIASFLAHEGGFRGVLACRFLRRKGLFLTSESPGNSTGQRMGLVPSIVSTVETRPLIQFFVPISGLSDRKTEAP